MAKYAQVFKSAELEFAQTDANSWVLDNHITVIGYVLQAIHYKHTGTEYVFVVTYEADEPFGYSVGTYNMPKTPRSGLITSAEG